MLSLLSEKMLLLSNSIKELEKYSEDSDICEKLDLESRIEESLTELSLFFQKLPKYQTTFEAIRQYYVEHIIKASRNKGD